MEEMNQQKQQELGLAIAEVVKDAEPVDTLMALLRSAYVVLRLVTVPDENGSKKERMRIMWNQFFDALYNDSGE